MVHILFTVAALHAFGGITGCADLVWHLDAEQVRRASSGPDDARYQGTGESVQRRADRGGP